MSENKDEAREIFPVILELDRLDEFDFKVRYESVDEVEEEEPESEKESPKDESAQVSADGSPNDPPETPVQTETSSPDSNPTPTPATLVPVEKESQPSTPTS